MRDAHVTRRIYIYTWKQGALLFPWFPLAAPCAPLPSTLHENHMNSAKALLSFLFLFLLISLFFPQVELCTIVRLKTWGFFSQYFSRVMRSTTKKMMVVACITMLSCHRFLHSYVIFENSGNFPRLDLSPEKIALYHGSRDEGVSFSRVYIGNIHSKKSKSLKSRNGICYMLRPCCDILFIKKFHKSILIRLFTNKNNSDSLVFRIVFLYTKYSCCNFLCVI